MQATSVSGKDDVTYAELESNTAFPDNFYFHIKIISMFVQLMFYFKTLYICLTLLSC